MNERAQQLQRFLLAVLVGVGGLGVFVSSHNSTAHATAVIPATISNISVSVDGSGTATYSLCAEASNQPLHGGIAVVPAGDTNPADAVRVTLSATGLCGPLNGQGTATFLQATFAGLPPGSYSFDSACIEANDLSVDCIAPTSTFVSGSGVTIATVCQIDFTTATPLLPVNCTGPGVQGDLVHSSGGSPTATSTPTATATVTPSPTATATPTETPQPALNVVGAGTVAPFQPVSLTGQGYGAREPVALFWDSPHTRPLTITLTTATGAFSTTLRVPQASAGSHSVIGVGLETTRAATATLRIKAALFLAPSQGSVGAGFVVIGAGFGANEPLTLYWNKPARLLGATSSNGLGTFAGSAAITSTVPLSATVGFHVVYAIGHTSHSVAVAGFVVRKTG